MPVVYQVKDTIFWKQITTLFLAYYFSSLLFIKSKIQFFESKSQLINVAFINGIGCLSSQRYNFLKANHNIVRLQSFFVLVVYQVKDTIFWKQITTHILFDTNVFPLFIKSKIQFFESKSQRQQVFGYYAESCLSSQRYNFLKANHNKKSTTITEAMVVYQVKDTIFWKQITTYLCGLNQLNCCLSSQRYNFLKANHNRWKGKSILTTVVYQVKDTIFWKQITTLQQE